MRKIKVFLDPGHNHSGYDTGAYGYGLKEQDITYLIAEKVKSKLERTGVKVKMSRNSITENCKNTSIIESLRHRSDMANEWGADYFVSIHCNAGGGTGTETYARVYGSKAHKLAEAVQSVIIKDIGLSDRGVKTEDFSVLVRTNMPAILVETAFIDKRKDATLLGSEEGRECFASAITKGIANYLNIKYEEGLTMSQYEELKNDIKDLTETVKMLANEIKNPMVYNYIDDNMPEWARPTIQKLVNKGILKGGDDGLNLTEDLMRIFVINDRAGLYD